MNIKPVSETDILQKNDAAEICKRILIQTKPYLY